MSPKLYTGPERRTTPRTEGTLRNILDITFKTIRKTEAR